MQVPGTSEIDTAAAVRDYLGDEARMRATASVGAAVGTDTSYEAELRAASQRTSVPISAARAEPDAVRRRAEAQQILETVQNFPSTMVFLADPSNARLSYDDTDALTRVESALGATARYVAGAPGSGKSTLLGDLGAGAVQAYRGAVGVAAMPFEAAAPVFDWMGGSNPAREVATGLRQRGARADELARQLSAPPSSVLQGGISSGVQSIAQTAITLPLGLAAGGVRLGVGLLSAITGGQSYLKAREKGVGVPQSALYGATDAAIEFATELVPVAGLRAEMVVRP